MCPFGHIKDICDSFDENSDYIKKVHCVPLCLPWFHSKNKVTPTKLGFSLGEVGQKKKTSVLEEITTYFKYDMIWLIPLQYILIN